MTNKKTNPEELDKAGKRKLLAVLIIAVLVVASLTIGYSIAGISQMTEKRNLLHNGAHTTGTVTKLGQTYVNGGAGRGALGWNVYTVNYTFAYSDTLNNQHMLAVYNAELPRQTFNSLRVGSKLAVTYLASVPKTNAPTASLTVLSADTSNIVLYMCALIVLGAVVAADRKTYGFTRFTKNTNFIVTLAAIFVAFIISGIIGGRIIGTAVVSLLQNVLY